MRRWADWAALAISPLAVWAALATIDACTLFGSPPPLPSPDVTIVDGQQQLARDKAIAHCEDVGDEAGTYAAYYDCTVKAGLRDAGGG